MTDADKLEMAARRLCALREQDPDERIIYSDNTAHLVARYKPRWRVVADELVRFKQLLEVANTL